MAERPFTRDLAIAITIGCALVIARSAVFVWYQQSFFDSDQAIVGLMAKHLSEGRAFPLFFYGQSYMLGVDAWLAALVFLVTGPSVSALHATLMVESVVAVSVLILALHRADRVSPYVALIGLLPIAFAPPITSSYFMDGAASAAPFAYIALLWMLRTRPLAFGALLAIGFLQREFVFYAAISLAALELLDGTLWRRDRIRQ